MCLVGARSYDLLCVVAVFPYLSLFVFLCVVCFIVDYLIIVVHCRTLALSV